MVKLLFPLEHINNIKIVYKYSLLGLILSGGMW